MRFVPKNQLDAEIESQRKESQAKLEKEEIKRRTAERKLTAIQEQLGNQGHPSGIENVLPETSAVDGLEIRNNPPMPPVPPPVQPSASVRSSKVWPAIAVALVALIIGWWVDEVRELRKELESLKENVEVRGLLEKGEFVYRLEGRPLQAIHKTAEATEENRAKIAGLIAAIQAISEWPGLTTQQRNVLKGFARADSEHMLGADLRQPVRIENGGDPMGVAGADEAGGEADFVGDLDGADKEPNGLGGQQDSPADRSSEEQQQHP